MSTGGNDGLLLVTGGDGQLGRAVARVAARRGRRALALGRAELDITDAARVHGVVGRAAPEAVVHCAAWTAVDDAEADHAGAFAVNEGGSRNVAAAARAVGARLAVVSTDYVFPGTNPDGYAEHDATDPVNAYGASKLAGEQAAQAEHPGVLIARTAWVFSHEGANFVRTILRLAASREAIDVVDDQVGSPTWTHHLATALVDALDAGLEGVVHLAGSPAATWHEVAREVVSAAGLACEVRPTTSDRFPRPAPRPACSILRATRPDTPAVGDWREGVRAVVAAELARR